MRTHKGLIIALFTSVLLLKVVLCVSTVYLKCTNQNLMNALIMQIEIEHDEPSTEELDDSLIKKYNITHSNLNFGNTANGVDIYLIHYNVYENLYPINSDYTKIVTPPPEFYS